MIDLSNAKVGDKYFDENKNKLECVFISDTGDFRYVFTGVKNGWFTGLYDTKGKNNSHCCVDIASKIDTRPWLKYMPDAGIFSDCVEWLEYNFDCECWFYAFNGDSCDMRNVPLKMPKPTGAHRSRSKISIEELLEWQEVNK